MTTEKVLNVKTGKMENCTVGAGCNRHAHNLESLKKLQVDTQEVTTPETKYYVFSQNNSGGTFIEPAKNVIIKASSAEEANNIAQSHGIYFDDNYEQDCECCGVRWDRANQYFSYASIDEAKNNIYSSDFDKEIPDFMIVEEQ